jgi:hypothetical protein
MEVSIKTSLLHDFKSLEWKALAAYLLIFILVACPFYNWPYRNSVNLLHVGVLFVSLLVILFSFFQNLTKRDYRKALISVMLGTMILCAGTFVQNLRYTITNYIIGENYCDLSKPVESHYILGGISEMRSADFPGRTGAFENSSHCLTVSCVEEFYYCSNAKMKIYR